MAETARKAQATMDKLANAFNSLLIIVDPFVTIFAGVVELFSKAANNPIGKFILQLTVYIGGLVGAFRLLNGSLAKFGSRLQTAGKFMRGFGKSNTAAGIRIGKLGKRVQNLGKTVSAAGARVQGFGGKVVEPFKKMGRAIKSPIKTLKSFSGILDDIFGKMKIAKFPRIAKFFGKFNA